MPAVPLRRLVAVLLLVSLSTLSLSAQQTKRNPEEQPRKVRQEPKKAYVEWINDVDLILTQSERDAWKKLATDDEREKFIEDFWGSRDPDPDTLENEFKEQYFERVAYANEHARTFILEPGRYKVDVIVRDTKSGAAGLRQVGFVVPEYPADRLSASSVVLAARLETMESGAAVGPFMIGTTKVVPNLSGTFKRSQPVGIYLQVYNAAVDEMTLRPAADAEYVLLKNGKEIGKQTEDWRDINDAGQRLTLSRLIDSRALEPGEYQIQVRIRDHVSGEAISQSATFTIVP